MNLSKLVVSLTCLLGYSFTISDSMADNCNSQLGWRESKYLAPFSPIKKDINLSHTILGPFFNLYSAEEAGEA